MKRTAAVFSKFISNKKYADIALLSLLCLSVVIINYIWISIEKRPPHWDMGRHLYNSVVYYKYFNGGDVVKLVTDYRYYPPFIYWAAVPFYFLLGLSIRTAILSNSLFIFILAFSTYGIGKSLWGRRTGLLSALFILLSPMIITQFKEFQLDAPSTAMVSLALYSLIKTKEFESRKWSIIFGLVFGFMMLTKWTLGFVMLLPILFAVTSAIINSWKNKENVRIINITLAFLIGYFIFSFWYIQNFGQLKYDLILNGGNAGLKEGDPAVGTYASNIWYFNNLISNQLYLVPFLFFITGLIFTFKKTRNYLLKNVYPLLLIAGTLLFFSMLRNKDARYTMPLLVGVAIVSTYWIGLLVNKTYKNLITAILVVYSLIVLFLISFGSTILPKKVNFGEFTVFAQKGYIIGPPTNENWRQEKIFDDITNQPGEKVLFISLSPEEMFFNSWGNRYYAELNNIEITDNLGKSNFVIAKLKDPILSDSKFVIIGEYPLPNGETAILLKKNNDSR